jgi:hypothetical protein
MAAPLSASDIAILQRAFAQVQAGDGAGGAALLEGLSAAAQGHHDSLTVAAFAQKRKAHWQRPAYCSKPQPARRRPTPVSGTVMQICSMN